MEHRAQASGSLTRTRDGAARRGARRAPAGLGESQTHTQVMIDVQRTDATPVIDRCGHSGDPGVDVARCAGAARLRRGAYLQPSPSYPDAGDDTAMRSMTTPSPDPLLASARGDGPHPLAPSPSRGGGTEARRAQVRLAFASTGLRLPFSDGRGLPEVHGSHYEAQTVLPLPFREGGWGVRSAPSGVRPLKMLVLLFSSLFLFLVALAPQPAYANGVPIRVPLTYLAGLSNWGPPEARG